MNFSVLTLKQLVLFQCTLSAHSLPSCTCVCVFVPVCVCIYFTYFAQRVNCKLLNLTLLAPVVFYLGLLWCCQAGLQ